MKLLIVVTVYTQGIEKRIIMNIYIKKLFINFMEGNLWKAHVFSFEKFVQLMLREQYFKIDDNKDDQVKQAIMPWIKIEWLSSKTTTKVSKAHVQLVEDIIYS